MSSKGHSEEPASRSLDALRAKVEAHLAAETGGPVEVRAIDRLSGGACQWNFRIDATISAGPLAGERTFVLRSDAPSSLPASIDRRLEFDVVRAAIAGGVRTAEARWLARDLLRDGAHAYFLDWIDGEALGRRVVGNPKLAAARKNLATDCARELAKIHAITPSGAPALFDGVLPRDPVDDLLGKLRAMLDGLGAPRPTLELAMRWLADHAPTNREVTLVHGDFRSGNFMVTETGLAAVLDWEFARWGTPGEDLGWIAVRDWRFQRLELPIGGFALREDFYRAYELESGRRVDRQELRWWEVLGNVRWAIGSVYQGQRFLAALGANAGTEGDDDVELIAIGRRAVEMEWEALRLIERPGAEAR